MTLDRTGRPAISVPGNKREFPFRMDSFTQCANELNQGVYTRFGQNEFLPSFSSRFERGAKRVKAGDRQYGFNEVVHTLPAGHTAMVE